MVEDWRLAVDVVKRGAVGEPVSDRAWRVESNGVNAIADAERHGSAAELFWVWCGANISILGVVYGVALVAFGLNLWQALVVALVGALSFVVVGALGVAGARSGLPMLTLSRGPFGRVGNLAPALVSWVDLLGWEAVNLLLAAFALLALAQRVTRAGVGGWWTGLALLVVAGVTFGGSALGHATVVRIQQGCTWAFGALTVVALGLLARHIRLAGLAHAAPGSWTHAVAPAVALLVAGTALGWTNTAADYTRYLPRGTAGRAIVGWTTLGAALPLMALFTMGVLVSAGAPGLASAANPLEAIAELLPAWFAAPYFALAIGGLIAGNVLASYSSGLNLLAMFVRVERYKTVVIDGVVSVAGALYVVYVRPDFYGALYTFLTLLAAGLAPWTVIMLVDMALRWGRYDGRAVARGDAAVRWEGVGAWVVATLLGLALTDSPLIHGPLARGVFVGSSLGYVVGGVAGGVLYGVALAFGRAPGRRGWGAEGGGLGAEGDEGAAG